MTRATFVHPMFAQHFKALANPSVPDMVVTVEGITGVMDTMPFRLAREHSVFGTMALVWRFHEGGCGFVDLYLIDIFRPRMN